MYFRHVTVTTFVLLIMLLPAMRANADLVTHNAMVAADNETTRLAWLADLDASAPQFFEDFESGYTDGQNIHGTALIGGLALLDSGGGTPTIAVEGTAGGIGGSNPIGNFAVEHDQQQYLVLDFTVAPVDYVSFYEIDTASTNYIVTYQGGSTETFTIDGTEGTGDSAEFLGFFRNDRPRIALIEADASGTSNWGIDNIAFGRNGIPEPATGAISCLMFIVAISARRRTRR